MFIARRLGIVIGALVASWVVASSACTPNAVFQCSQDSECVSAGPDGRCEATNFCSFPDESCRSGFRYPEDAGHDLAGQCADDEQAGTGSSSGSGTGTGTTTDDGPGPSSDSGSDAGDDRPDDSSADDSTADDTGGFCDVVGPFSECDPSVDTEPVPCAELGFGFDSGTAECDRFCQWNTSQCAGCGNRRVERGEVCDGPIVSRNCISLGKGYTGGVLTCSDDCTAIDESGCFTCGNDEVEFGEACDGSLLEGTDCATLGYADGPVECGDDCLTFETGMCTGVSCGVDPPAPASPCPPECTSCEGGVCTIECSGAECEDQTVTCPPGRPCRVVCDGIDTCQGGTIVCPEYHACDVECDGIDACDGLSVACGAVGSCGVSCQGFTCEGLSVNCGGDVCLASCTTVENIMIDCGSSCSCSGECEQN